MLETFLAVAAASISFIGTAIKIQNHVDARFDDLSSQMLGMGAEMRVAEERTRSSNEMLNFRVAALERDMMRVMGCNLEMPKK